MSEKPVILFESYPNFSGSPQKIYKELVKRGYDSKYDLIWAVYSTFNEKTNYKIVKFHGCNTPEKRAVLARTKIIIDSNRYIHKPRPDVYRIHTRHGCSFKKCVGYYSDVGAVDAILTTSDEMKKIDQQVWPPIVKNKFVITGLPSLDRLFQPTDVYSSGFIKELVGCDTKFDKIIGWLPTFRKHRFGGRLTGKKYAFGLPTINVADDFLKLNTTLVEHNCLLIIQMHHAQSKDYKQLPKCSNIAFVNETIKKKYDITTHALMSAFDAMITDYSAAYHEYIILNRPIALTVDDLIQYNRDEGFCYNYIEWIKGEYILDCSDLCDFVENVALNNDVAKEEREISLHKIHKHIDNNSTNRVIDLLVNKL
jgi:CDP-glycerol glycerophosphotransferase (TagB/SpsB family)